MEKNVFKHCTLEQILTYEVRLYILTFYSWELCLEEIKSSQIQTLIGIAAAKSPNVDRFQHLYRSSSISRKGVSNVIVVVIFKMATTTRTAAGSTYHFLESFKALMGIEGWIVGTTPLILGLKSFKLGQPWRRPPPYIQPLNHPRASILWPNSCKCLNSK